MNCMTRYLYILFLGCYVFPNGAELLISFHEDQHLKKIIDSILLDSEIFYGLCVKDITIVGSPVFTEEPQRFFLASPIFIKRRIEEIMGYKYYFYDDQESNQLMTETLKHKMREAGLPEDDTLRVEFDISYSKKKKKMVKLLYVLIREKCSLKVSKLLFLKPILRMVLLYLELAP